MIEFQPSAESPSRVRSGDDGPVRMIGASPSIAPSGSDGSAGALILGGAHGSLAVARSLGRRGIPVAFIAAEPLIPRYSRYVGRTWSWPGARDPHAVQWLLDHARRNDLKGWVLFPEAIPKQNSFRKIMLRWLRCFASRLRHGKPAGGPSTSGSLMSVRRRLASTFLVAIRRAIATM